MSLLKLEKIKSAKKNIISSLEASTKNSNSIKSYVNKNYKLNKSNSQCILPIIHYSKLNKKKPLYDSTSILSKFITNHTSKIIKETINTIMNESKNILPSKIRNIDNNFYKSKSLNDIFINKNENNSNSSGIYITESIKKDANLIKYKKNKNINYNNRVSSKIILEKKNIGEEITSIKNTTH